MRRTRRTIIGGWAAAALIIALLPFDGAVADTAAPDPTETAPAVPSASPSALAEDPTPAPSPDPEPEPEPEPTPEPTATSTPRPAPSPEPTSDPGDEHDDHEHDGPTMPLTRELPPRTLAPTARLAGSYGPQPFFRFPFAPGARWAMSGSHADSDGIHRGAIDFAPLGSSAKAVRAIASGQVYRVRCASGWFLGVDHGGGWLSEYYHLSGAKGSLVGKWVEAGTVLGKAAQTLPCGGTPGTSAHVHLSILNESVSVPSGKRKYIPVSGIQFDRFTLHDTSGYYNGVWRDATGKTVLNSRRVTCCLTADDRVGPKSPAATLPDVNGNGIDDRAELTPWNTDVNRDGRADIVGFGGAGVMVSRSNGSAFTTPTRALSSFGSSTGWSTTRHLRMVTDVTGDGVPDIVGFSFTGVYVSRGNGSGGFAGAQRWSTDFGSNAGWSLSSHVRTLADVTGDGRLDVIGFGSNGVSVGVNTGSGFAPSKQWLKGMGSAAGAGGWSTVQDVRLVTDMNGDGRADLVGMGKDGVYVALSTGSGFEQPRRWTASFSRDKNWRQDITPRMVIDVNGDGRPDVVGFSRTGVFVALNTGSGFGAAKRWASSFGRNSGVGWRTDRDPRTLADVTGDGRPDVVGFRQNGVYVARNTGSGFAKAVRWTSDFGSKEWTLGAMPRAVVDVNGDGRADIVGFGPHGARVALSTGSRFTAATHGTSQFGYTGSSGAWHVRTKPRGLSAG